MESEGKQEGFSSDTWQLLINSSYTLSVYFHYYNKTPEVRWHYKQEGFLGHSSGG